MVQHSLEYLNFNIVYLMTLKDEKKSINDNIVPKYKSNIKYEDDCHLFSS